MGSNSYLLSQETDTYDIVHIMLNLIGFDNFHVSFMFHVSIGFDNSNAYLCNRPATDTVVSYSNDNFFIQMNASCLSLSFHQKRGATGRGWGKIGHSHLNEMLSLEKEATVVVRAMIANKENKIFTTVTIFCEWIRIPIILNNF